MGPLAYKFQSIGDCNPWSPGPRVPSIRLDALSLLTRNHVFCKVATVKALVLQSIYRCSYYLVGPRFEELPMSDLV